MLVAEVSELPPPLQHPHRDQEGYLVLESDLHWNPSPPPAHCAPGALSLVLSCLLCKMRMKVEAPSWGSYEDQTQSLLRKFSDQPIKNTHDTDSRESRGLVLEACMTCLQGTP